MTPLRFRRVGHRAPSPPHPSASCRAAGPCRAAPVATPSRPVHRCGPPESRPAAAGSEPHLSTVTGPSLTRRSPIIVHAPGFGVTARIRRSTTWAGRSQRTRASSTVTFGATVTPSAGCGTGDQRSVGDAVERRLQQRGTRNRQPVKQIARGVGRPDRLGDDAVDRPGVQRGFDLERRRAGHRVARRDRRLHRRRAPPRGQQREVQVDPAVRRAPRADRRAAARRTPPPRSSRAPVRVSSATNSSELGRVGPQHRDAVLERQLRHRRRRRLGRAGPTRRPGGSAPRPRRGAASR